MEFLRGDIYFFIIAIGEYANHSSAADTVSLPLRDRALYSGFITLGSCGLELSWIRPWLRIVSLEDKGMSGSPYFCSLSFFFEWI